LVNQPSNRADKGVAQLTLRATLTGLLLGFMFSMANVYIGLRTGWFFGMALASILVSFAVWKMIGRPLGILEATSMQSTASSAAYATGNAVVGAIPAVLLMTGEQPSWPLLAAWVATTALLGIAIAIPLKRQLIDRERLAFPSGTAAAVMLEGLERGERAPLKRLFGAIGASALLVVLRDLARVIPPSSRPFGAAAAKYGLVLDHGALLAAAGVFVGLRVAAWMVIGGLITAFALGPIALDAGAATDPGTLWLDVGVWIGAPLLVAHAMVSLAANRRAFARIFTRGDSDVPIAWFWAGLVGFGAAAIAIGHIAFDIPIALGVIAVALAVVFGAVACRVTGETDVTPGGPMGKLAQLGFGMLRPQHPSTNLMTAALTHASSTASADLLNDLKCGSLLGADPKRQLVAQALGVLAGTAGSVLAYYLLVPDAQALSHVPAPAAHQFRAIAELLEHGLASLHPLQRVLVVAGAIAGVAASLGERYRRWLPSAAGLGLGLLLPLSASLSMLIGAAIARWRGEREVWPIAAGALAGESLAGIAVALIDHLGR
jgi:uncharacterized oligopeptide transporter (OPT) family protein